MNNILHNLNNKQTLLLKLYALTRVTNIRLHLWWWHYFSILGSTLTLCDIHRDIVTYSFHHLSAVKVFLSATVLLGNLVTNFSSETSNLGLL